MIPLFNDNGILPPGIHWAEWDEVAVRFGTSGYRRLLLQGLKRALEALRASGCTTAYMDGSFTTDREFPGDYDCCWSAVNVDPRRLDPVFLDFSDRRATQKTKYCGEFFPAETVEGGSGKVFLEFFQIDKDTGSAKGIVAIDLQRLP